MIIAEVCNYAPDYGGNFIASLNSMERFAKKVSNNNEVIYVFPHNAEDKEWVTKLQIDHRVFFLPYGRVKGSLFLLRLCRNEKIDILHLHFYGLFTGLLAGCLSKVRAVHHFHNTWDEKNRFKALLLRCCSFPTKKLVGCSKAVYDTLIEAGFSKNKTTYITNCIDFSRLDTIKVENPYHNNKNNILILGSDFYRKGVDNALKALEGIIDKYQIQLNIISHRVEETKDLVRQVLGTDSDPSWVTVLQPVENIGDLYRASAMFLSPSLAEGLCYAVPEALYCDCMVLKNDIPSLTYELEGEDSITIKGFQDLRSRIEDYLENENRYKNTLSSLRTQVKEKYSIDKWGEEVFELYKDMIDCQ